MFIKENIMLAIAGLKSNKMRALLTMLGIIIGIASVIGVVSVGNAMSSSVTNSMGQMGASNITVNVQQKDTSSSTNSYSSQGNNSQSGSGNNRNASGNNGTNRSGGTGGANPLGGAGRALGGGAPGGAPGGGRPGGATAGRPGSSKVSSTKDTDLITMEQIQTLQSNFSDEIDSISINENGSSGKVKSGTAYANVQINGTNIGFQNVKNIQMQYGSYFSQDDIDGARNVAVVSDKLVTNVFGSGVNPVGQDIQVYTSNAIYTYTVIGVYQYKSQGNSRTDSDANLTTDLYIPISVEKKTATNKNYQTFQIKAKDGVNVQDLTNNLSNYLANLYARNSKFQASASNMESMLESMTSMMSSISMAISAIAAISLFVGGIGVMNIMLVSVTERTREIGTRKALGAKSGQIKMQFIVESMIICAIGGIIGIILGLGAGAMGSKAMGYSTTVSPFVVIASFTFSMFIGVFFGYYPAKKAAELDPIEALRYE
ncbi:MULTISPECIES: ABC transporter permease [Clostridium]|jgi:putative ABC transport system permease protein|uniref:ABC transporter permease n=1 Tax=Clostridium TaxID=1485 RepID=UPI000983E018|nr:MULTISPECIES: ABC transporter permease [Clostridium]AQR95826.1 macrolide export ATP-binding/permease protein MacB [Clostridium saccharoperbutylacetonicum]NSB31689.1 putative ABC transport system permease protein [Clostridium saccharoperbutylacetonicum]